MGFSLEQFMKELEYRISHCQSHTELLKYIQEQYAYAKECGQIK
jgi:hypothetical protein